MSTKKMEKSEKKQKSYPFLDDIKSLKNKRIIVFGGSFNPPHIGHIETAKKLYNAVDCDAVLFLFSQNRFKDENAYAPTSHRKKMVDLLASRFDDTPIIYSDAENELGTSITADVLASLQDRHPEAEFMWSMGADSLAGFHKWERYEVIADNCPIIVIGRPGYNEDALNSETAKEYKKCFYSRESDFEKRTSKNGIIFLEDFDIDMSSSSFLKKLRENPDQDFGEMQVIADYIKDNNLYGLDTPKANRKKKRKKRTKMGLP